MQKRKFVLVVLVAIFTSVAMSVALTTPKVHAEELTISIRCQDGETGEANSGFGLTPEQFCADRGGPEITIADSGASIIKVSCGDNVVETDYVVGLNVDDICSSQQGSQTTSSGEKFPIEGDCVTDPNDPDNSELNEDNCAIFGYIIKFTNMLAGLVGIVIVIMITVGGIQYSTSRDNPQAVEAARKKIYNAVLALIVFIFAVAFLNWLVPGGVF